MFKCSERILINFTLKFKTFDENIIIVADESTRTRITLNHEIRSKQ